MRLIYAVGCKQSELNYLGLKKKIIFSCGNFLLNILLYIMIQFFL
jgi:hypothetical protein